MDNMGQKEEAMNKTASIIAATLTTALCGGIVSAIAVSQDLVSVNLDLGTPDNAVAYQPPSPDTAGGAPSYSVSNVTTANDAMAAATAQGAAAQSAAVEPEVVYVDGEPTFVTRKIVVSGGSSAQGAASAQASSSPSASSTPTPSQASADASPSASASASASSSASASASADASPDSSPSSGGDDEDDDDDDDDSDDDQDGDDD